MSDVGDLAPSAAHFVDDCTLSWPRHGTFRAVDCAAAAKPQKRRPLPPKTAMAPKAGGPGRPTHLEGFPTRWKRYEKGSVAISAPREAAST